MQTNYLQKKNHFHKYFILLFVSLGLSCVFLFITGAFHGKAPFSSIYQFIFGFLGLLSIIVSYLLIIHLNSIFPASELNSTNKNIHSSPDYDVYTGLLYQEAFLNSMSSLAKKNVSSGCLAVFHIEALELLQRLIGRKRVESLLHDIAKVLNSISDVTYITGCKSTNEYWVFYYNTNKETVLTSIDVTMKNLEQVFSIMPDLQISIFVNCGYAWYPKLASNINTLFSYADFALYEAMIFKKLTKHEFSLVSYQKQEWDYKRNATFFSLLKNNDFIHYFQPIVSSRDGSIY